MALEAFKMARTSQSKLIAISSNPKTIMLLLIVGSNGYPEVSQHGKNHEDIMFEVQVDDKTSWILTDWNGGAGGDSSPSLLPSPAASRADLAASLSSTDA